MDGEVTPDATRKSQWTNFAICTTDIRVMVAYIIFELLFIVPGYQIYINYFNQSLILIERITLYEYNLMR